MKRKLFLGLAALAALTITSCQKDLVINQIPEEQPIGFGTYVGRDAQTKASVVTTETMKTEGFGVFAYYTAQNNFASTDTPNFMYNQNVSWDETNGVWTYSPVKYWPNNTNDKISFFAYAPYDENSTTNNNTYLNLSELTATGVPTVTYTVDTDVDNHIDVLFADNSNKQNLTKQTVGEKINFEFKHALSRVGFTAQAIVDNVTDASNSLANGTSIKINSITLNGNFYKSGTLDLSNGNWTTQNSNQFHNSITINAEDLGTTNVTNTESNLHNVSNSDPDKGYMMIIPYTISGADNNTLTITVNYTVTTIDSNLTSEKSDITNNITSGVMSIDFQQGKAYTFALKLGMTSVKIEAEVTDWGDPTAQTVNVPLNKADVTPGI